MPHAVLISGPPATGKSTLAAALAPRLRAALLDLDVATGPLTRVVSDLAGVRDLDDPALAGLTRAARYETLLGLAQANLRAERPVVLVAPFGAERSRPSAWAAATRLIPAEPLLVWLHLPPEELIRRLTRRALARDQPLPSMAKPGIIALCHRWHSTQKLAPPGCSTSRTRPG